MKRVFMVSRRPLFQQGVQSLLCQEQDIFVVGCETDIAPAIEQIKKLRPDVVIVDTSDPACDATSEILRALEGSDQRVIGMSLLDSTIHVYHDERLIIRGVEDLIRAVRCGKKNGKAGNGHPTATSGDETRSS